MTAVVVQGRGRPAGAGRQAEQRAPRASERRRCTRHRPPPPPTHTPPKMSPFYDATCLNEAAKLKGLPLQQLT